MRRKKIQACDFYQQKNAPKPDSAQGLKRKEKKVPTDESARFMLIQFLPSLMMFAITLVFVTAFFIPVTAFKQKNELIRFYWVGVWFFLAMIAAFAGGSQTLLLLGYNAHNIATAMLTSLTVCFVLFVMFGWCRLSFSAIQSGITYLIKKRKTT